MALAHTAPDPDSAYSVHPHEGPQCPLWTPALSSSPCLVSMDPTESRLLKETRTPHKMRSGCEEVIKQHGLRISMGEGEKV